MWLGLTWVIANPLPRRLRATLMQCLRTQKAGKREMLPPSCACSPLSWWVKLLWLQQICGIKWRSRSTDKETVPIPEKLLSLLYLLTLTQPNMKICSVNRDVLLWLHTPLCSSANPKGNACQTLPPLYRCATCALTLSCVGESTSQHWDIALLFFVNSDKQCQLRFVTVPSKDEHPNPTDLNLNPFVNTEHPFPALCS